MTNFQKPDPRLFAAAKLVRGDFIIDVGTDHAILPVYLCLSGKISRAIASDINRGPLERAKKNIERNGLSDKIEAVLTAGLCGLDDRSPTDIVIAGMGGIMIKDIISTSALAKKAHLVLQPMTHAHILRGYLTENGFDICEERLARADGRVYVIISAQYTGKGCDYSEAELYSGRFTDEYKSKNSALCSEHYEKLLSTLKKKTELGGDKTAARLYNEIYEMKKELPLCQQ